MWKFRDLAVQLEADGLVVGEAAAATVLRPGVAVEEEVLLAHDQDHVGWPWIGWENLQ